MKPVAIVTDVKGVSFREVSKAVASVIKKDVKTTIYNWDIPKIKEHNILFVGNVFHLTISYVQRFLPEKNVVFYAITEGDPILDYQSRKLAQPVRFVAPSHYVKKCLQNVGLVCDDVVWHGVDMNNPKYDRGFYDYVKSLVLPSTKVFLCTAGNVFRKALDKLMVAFKTVEKIHKDSFLILHSGIGDTNIVALQDQLDLKRFWFTNQWGTLEQPKLNALFKLCDAYVQPSMVEGFGIPYIEAFRFNKPVIGVNCPATNEIVQDGVTGMLIPVRKVVEGSWAQRHALKLHYFDVDDLIDAMVLMAEASVREKFSQEISREKHKFDMDTLYKRFLEFFE
jgi:glycosyltransferase involved in cell wall biosynthesis